MFLNKLNVALSGFSHRNIKDFWIGFIELQKRLPKNVEITFWGHTWNPKYLNDLKRIYGSENIKSSTQDSYLCDFLSNTADPTIFESNINRSKTFFSKVDFQRLLGQAKSRSILVNFIKGSISENESLLITRWDIGSVKADNNSHIINIDSDLNNNYIYIPYWTHSDEGYADMWIYSNMKNLEIFSKYSEYLLNSITLRNNFFDDFTKSGWPFGEKTFLNKYSKFFDSLFNLSLKYQLELTKKNAKLRSMIFNILFIILHKMKLKFEEEFFFTGENSNLIDLTKKTSLKFPAFQALNYHAIYKHFLIHNNLREKIRFLSHNDFQNTNLGVLINPKEINLVIYSEETIQSVLELQIQSFKKNISYDEIKIFILTSIDHLDLSNHNVKIIKYSKNLKYSQRIKNSLEMIDNKNKLTYFINAQRSNNHTICKFYFNALIHYMMESNIYFVDLSNKVRSVKSIDENFPNLNNITSNEIYGLDQILIDIDHFKCILESKNLDIDEFEGYFRFLNLNVKAIHLN